MFLYIVSFKSIFVSKNLTHIHKKAVASEKSVVLKIPNVCTDCT